MLPTRRDPAGRAEDAKRLGPGRDVGVPELCRRPEGVGSARTGASSGPSDRWWSLTAGLRLHGRSSGRGRRTRRQSPGSPPGPGPHPGRRRARRASSTPALDRSAASATSLASRRPSFSAKRNEACSAITSPPASSRFDRMRLTSISNPSSARRAASAAPPAKASAPDSAGHSACHAPSAPAPPAGEHRSAPRPARVLAERRQALAHFRRDFASGASWMSRRPRLPPPRRPPSGS